MKDEKKHKHLPLGGFYEYEELDDDDFDTIANVIGLSDIPSEFKLEIRYAIQNYLSGKDYVIKPSPSEVISALKTLIKRVNAYLRNISNPQKTKALMDFLNIYSGADNHTETIDDLSLQLLCESGVFEVNDLYRLLEAKSLTRKEAKKLKEASVKSLDYVGIDVGGRPKTRAGLHNFICNLASIYERLTGKRASITYDNYVPRRPYKGKFYDFVHEMLVTIYANDVINENISLGQEIKSTLKIYRSNPQAYRLTAIPTISE